MGRSYLERSRTTCEMCQGVLLKDTMGAPNDGEDWDGAHPCPCGGRHRVCYPCATHFGLSTFETWGWAGDPLAMCPFTDEFQVAAEVIGGR